jgi:tetratricopeptide (TPR) repeat protein
MLGKQLVAYHSNHTTIVMEVLLAFLVAGLIYYLKLRAKHADLRTNAEKESQQIRVGIDLYNRQEIPQALAYFKEAIQKQPGLSLAYLYRARCFRAMGDMPSALADLNTAKSYDDSQFDIHLEIGQIHFHEQDYATAFLDFDKAVFHSHGKKAEPYRWRGITRQQLGQDLEAQQDLQKGAAIQQAIESVQSFTLSTKGPFFDWRLLLYCGLTVVNSFALLMVIKICPVVHGPYLMAAATSVIIGLADSRKGWVLALIQAFILWFGYHFLMDAPKTNADSELETFGLYGSLGLTFVGSYVGSILITEYRRAANFEP